MWTVVMWYLISLENPGCNLIINTSPNVYFQNIDTLHYKKKVQKGRGISSRYVFSYVYPFYFEFHGARVIFDVSSGFYFCNVNRTPTLVLSKMFKVAFKDVSTKNGEPTY